MKVEIWVHKGDKNLLVKSNNLPIQDKCAVPDWSLSTSDESYLSDKNIRRGLENAHPHFKHLSRKVSLDSEWGFESHQKKKKSSTATIAVLPYILVRVRREFHNIFVCSLLSLR